MFKPVAHIVGPPKASAHNHAGNMHIAGPPANIISHTEAQLKVGIDIADEVAY